MRNNPFASYAFGGGRSFAASSGTGEAKSSDISPITCRGKPCINERPTAAGTRRIDRNAVVALDEAGHKTQRDACHAMVGDDATTKSPKSAVAIEETPVSLVRGKCDGSSVSDRKRNKKHAEHLAMALCYDEALATLQSMFAQGYTAAQLNAVLRHHGGHMENTVETLLSHGEGTPDDLIRRLRGRQKARSKHFSALSSVKKESGEKKKEMVEIKEVSAKAKACGTDATATAVATSKSVTPTKPKRKLRQAQEQSDGAVEILCFACRRDPSQKIQKSMGCFFTAKSVSLDAPSSSASSPAPPLSGPASIPVCSRCRQPLKRPAKAKHGNAPLRRCPFIKRLEGYKKMASDNALPFDLSDSKALAIMRMPCSLCGENAGSTGGGLTRLRVWPDRHKTARNGQGKQFMGPFCAENLAPACGRCNLMKGPRRPRAYVEAARHIATHRAETLRRLELAALVAPSPGAPLEDFGRYPHRFRDNTSRRSRSNYITASSTHTKTHSMTNEEFRKITSGPCHYCGKEPRSDPPHYNGLDRLDSNERVYSALSSVAACGDCNVMKYTHSEEVFLLHCLKVARFHRGVEFGEEEGEHQSEVTEKQK